jgi:HK97 family phage major capsid protein
MKKLLERKNQLISEMSAMLNKAETETRAFTDEEESTYSEKLKQLDGVEKLIKRKEEMRAKEIEKPEEKKEEKGETVEQAEERAFAEFCRTGRIPEERAEAGNMTMKANGAVIPTTIAQRVLRKFEEICPIYEKATKFHFKGNVDFPVIDESSDTVYMDYATEFKDVDSHVMAIDTVSLGGHLASALALVSKSLINNAEIDIVSVVVTQMALAHKRFFEQQLLHGSDGKMVGAFSTTNKITAAAQSVISADELIDLQGMVPSAYQSNAAWYMSEKTRDAIRKLKDADGRYLLEWDFKEFSGGRLLGKPVYLSEKIDDMAAGKDVILYGDLSGLYVNLREEPTLDVIKEKYATMHAVGFNEWLEADSKIAEPQKFAKLSMAD